MAAHSSTLAWKIPWMEEPGGVAKSLTRLSDFTFTFHFHALEKEMATHSSVLAWRIPGTAEPGGLPSMGSHRVGHDWSDLAAYLYISICIYTYMCSIGYVSLENPWLVHLGKNGYLLANVTWKSVDGWSEGFRWCHSVLVSLHLSEWLLSESALTSDKPSWWLEVLPANPDFLPFHEKPKI